MKGIGRVGTLCRGGQPHIAHTGRRAMPALCACLLLLLVCLPSFAGAARSTRKLIATGWDGPDTKRLRENIADMEKRPFDGVFFNAVGVREDGKPCGIRSAHSATPWKKEWFQTCVDDLKATKFTTFTDNFLTIGANPGNVDWFDDAGWAAIVEHWRIAAWVAKQGGVTGVQYDPEPYEAPFAQFSYAAQTEKDKHTFNEYYEKARQRGREVMAATVAEFPGLTLYCYFMNCVNFQAVTFEDPRPALAGSGYGLFPAFIDGWLDAAPPDVTFVDGCENAYMFNSEMDFYAAAVKIKGACQQLVAPENRGKYRAQVQVSFGIYLDAYWNEKGPYFIDGKGGPRVNRLLANTACGLDVADEYVWMYGEKNRWWPTPNGGVNKESWAEALPGSEDALRWARDPADFARDRITALRQAGTLVNLARNADFGAATAPDVEGKQQDWKDGGAPAGWSFWQTDKSKGVIAWDRETGATAPGSARAANVENGCFIQTFPVKPGDRYAVRTLARCQGRSSVSVRVRWQTADRKWTKETQDVILSPGAAVIGDWREIFGAVTIPEEVGNLVLLLGMSSQFSDQDVAWFDDVEVHALTLAPAGP
ncbi:MAG: hypothetical protein A3K18_08140 [Lentisphaerae bacterium RIFOXYA12_64_32]|nr:MAG: hypothetical protein A3K18_08140 [Lentisphaerae bacterium RIFOXYA12_64_32]